MNMTEDFIISYAGNAQAAAKGKATANDFVSLSITEDESLIFGQCRGSAKKPYSCSVDFIDAEKPVPRCNCPSRQVPCKHAIGLLYAYASQKKKFKTEDVPEDVQSKRDKIQHRAERSAEEKPKEMTRAKANAAVKKCQAQLEGIEIAEKILANIALSGIQSIDAQGSLLLSSQIKELGNYYIPGIQASFSDLIGEVSLCLKNQIYTEAFIKMNYLRALLKKSKSHTENKMADFKAFPNMTDTALNDSIHSQIEEQMGYAWKLSELEEHGLMRENDELIQLSFTVYEDAGKMQWIDEGVWASLKDGALFYKFNYRPFRAGSHVQMDDSSFPVFKVSDVHIYPGELNHRIRWEKSEMRLTTLKDLNAIIGFARTDFVAAAKLVKNQSKNPLSDKNPVLLLKISSIKQDKNGSLAIVDEKGSAVLLKMEGFSYLIRQMSKKQLLGSAIVCRFGHDFSQSLLYATPLSAVTGNGIMRFQY
ncbi:MAG: SWIM zinc finger domain-containing protein [Clostridiales bacterium]|jgi:hypothetical protein|nr:SWIM zinc finger domain-containing protein [Clostridiales bacterium]